MIDIFKLEHARITGGKLVARCPACAGDGADKKGDHLFIADEGRGKFGCIAFPGTSGQAHRKRICELVGDVSHNPPPAPTKPVSVESMPAYGHPRLPVLHRPSVGELAHIAEARGWLLFAGLEILAGRGLLYCGDVWDDGVSHEAWIVTDSTRRNAQARRMDGKPWACGKAKTLPGSAASWPIGCSEIGERPLVVLCEGGPDFLAAPLLAWLEGLDLDQIAPVCIAGAGHSIPLDALPFFKGKRVRIATQLDAKKQGRSAALRWARQLREAGAGKVDGMDLAGLTTKDGKQVKDIGEHLATIKLCEGDEPEQVERVLFGDFDASRPDPTPQRKSP